MFIVGQYTSNNTNINLFKIFALLFNALNSGLPRFLTKARNYDYAFYYASKFEIISHNKNLKSIAMSMDIKEKFKDEDYK